MTYDPTLPGIDEATRAWIISNITSNLSSLNAALSRDNLTPVGTLTGDMVLFGDPQILPSVDIAPVLFCIQGGGRIDGLDVEMEQATISPNPGYIHTLYSSIIVYIHPDALPNNSGAAQESSRERLLARICDWLKAIFNSGAAVSPTLTSKTFAISPGFDTLDRAHLSMIEKGWITKSFAGSQLIYHAHARHSAIIAGSY